LGRNNYKNSNLRLKYYIYITILTLESHAKTALFEDPVRTAQ